MRTEMKGSIKHTALNLLSSRVILRKFIIPYPQEFIWCGRQLSNIALISIATHEFLLYALNVALLMLDTFEGENLAECKCMIDYPTVCHVADAVIGLFCRRAGCDSMLNLCFWGVTYSEIKIKNSNKNSKKIQNFQKKCETSEGPSIIAIFIAIHWLD